MAILVMLNSYFHDLSVALVMCGMLLLWFLDKEVVKEGSRTTHVFFEGI